MLIRPVPQLLSGAEPSGNAQRESVISASYGASVAFARGWSPRRRAHQSLFLLGPTVVPILLALVAGRGGLPFYVGYAFCIALLVGFTWFCRLQPLLLIGGLAVWLFIARIVLASMTDILTPNTLSALLAYSQFFFPIVLVILAPRILLVWRSTPRLIRCLDVAAVAFLVVIGVAVLLGTDPILDRIVYARRFTVLPMVYLAVRLLPFQKGDTRRLAMLGLIAGVILAAFGILERFPLSGFVWGTIADPVSYYQMAAYSGSAREITIIQCLPLTFWTSDGGQLTRRLVSTSLEASTIAAFFGLITTIGVTLVGAAISGWKAALLILIAGVAMFLTLGKAGIAIGAVGAGYTIAARALPILRRPLWVIGLAAAAGLGLFLVGVFVEASGIASSVGAHLSGLRAGIDSLMAHPFGIGIGSTGVFAQDVKVSESAVGVLMAQLGWPGVLMWAPWVVVLGLATIIRSDRITDAPFVGLGVGAAVIAFFGASLLTESANGLLWNWAFPLLAAALLTESALDQRPDPRPFQAIGEESDPSSVHIASATATGSHVE